MASLRVTEPVETSAAYLFLIYKVTGRQGSSIMHAQHTLVCKLCLCRFPLSASCLYPHLTDKETEDHTDMSLAKQILELVRLQVQRGHPRPHLGLRERKTWMAVRRFLTACVSWRRCYRICPGGIAETPLQVCHAGSHVSFSALITSN